MSSEDQQSSNEEIALTEIERTLYRVIQHEHESRDHRRYASGGARILIHNGSYQPRSRKIEQLPPSFAATKYGDCDHVEEKSTRQVVFENFSVRHMPCEDA